MEEAPKILNNINEYVDLIASEVIAVYEKSPTEKLILNKKMVEFKKYLREYLNNAVIIKFNEKDYTSSKKEYISCNSDINRISSPINYALTAIDFSTSFYPAKLCYAITPKLEVGNYTYHQAIDQQKKVATVQQKILNMYNNYIQIKRTINGINKNGISEYKIKLQTLSDIIVEVNNIRNRHGKISELAINRLRKIWKFNKELVTNSNDKPNYFILEILNSCYEGELSKKYIDLAGKEAIKQIIKIDYSQRKELNTPSHTQTSALVMLSNLLRATTLHDRLLPNNQKVSLYLYVYMPKLTKLNKKNNEGLEPVNVKSRKLTFK